MRGNLKRDLTLVTSADENKGKCHSRSMPALRETLNLPAFALDRMRRRDSAVWRRCNLRKKIYDNWLTGFKPRLYCAPFQVKGAFRDFPVVDGL